MVFSSKVALPVGRWPFRETGRGREFGIGSCGLISVLRGNDLILTV